MPVLGVRLSAACAFALEFSFSLLVPVPHSMKRHHLSSRLPLLSLGNSVPPPTRGLDSSSAEPSAHTMKVLTRPQPPYEELQSKW